MVTRLSWQTKDTSVTPLSEGDVIFGTELHGLACRCGYRGFTLVTMRTEVPSQQDLWLIPIVSGNLGTKYKLNMT